MEKTNDDLSQEIIKSETKNSNLISFNNNQMEVLQHLIKSKVLPESVKTVETAYAIVMFGKELGFSLMQSFSHIILVNGKPTVSAVACNALMQSNGILVETIYDGHYYYPDGSYHYIKKGGDDKPLDRVTTLKVTRNYNNQVISHEVNFTWFDAKTQELTDKDNWKRMPREMLYARCLSKAIRRIAPDILLGLYTTDEVVDSERIDESKVTRDEEGRVITINI